MWLAIDQRVPSWDIMQKISQQGVGRCPLCSVCEENVNQLLIHYSYEEVVQKETQRMTSKKFDGEGRCLKFALTSWVQNHSNMKYKGIESLKHEIQRIADHSKRPHIVRGFGNALGGHFFMPLAGIW